MTTKDLENKQVSQLTNLELFSVLKKRISDNKNKGDNKLTNIEGPIVFPLNSYEDVLTVRKLLLEAGDSPYALLVSQQALCNIYSLEPFNNLSYYDPFHTGRYGFSGTIFGIPVYNIKDTA